MRQFRLVLGRLLFTATLLFAAMAGNPIFSGRQAVGASRPSVGGVAYKACVRSDQGPQSSNEAVSQGDESPDPSLEVSASSAAQEVGTPPSTDSESPQDDRDGDSVAVSDEGAEDASDKQDDPPAMVDPDESAREMEALELPDDDASAERQGSDAKRVGRPVVQASALAEGENEPPGEPPSTEGDEPSGSPLEQVLAAGPAPSAVSIEPAVFLGVQPGVTTPSELEKAWGPPLETHRQEKMVQYIYELEGFKSVAVTLLDGKVSSMLVELEKNYPAETLARQLGLEKIVDVAVTDAQGEALGLAFPERGVLFSFDPRSDAGQVAQVVLETIDVQPFVLRAKMQFDRRPLDALRDVNHALELDAEIADAHALRAKLLERMGRYDEALEAAEAAVRLESKQPRSRLTRAKILERTGQFVRAIAETKAAIDLGDNLDPQVKAEGLLQLGDQIAQGPGRDFKLAIDYHIKAIRTAESLVEDRRAEVRHAARRVAMAAYLATAGDVAWGSWRRKKDVVTKWLDRAEERIETLAENDRDRDEMRFAVARAALAADVGMRGELDPAAWVKRVETLGRRRIEQADDLVVRGEAQWDLGMALYDALQINQMRGESDRALELGQMAIDYLEQAAPLKRELPGFPYLMGRLAFRIGAIYAAQSDDHAAAVEWFNRAVPLMEEPIPVTAVADVGRQGETFVSMAVSYWEVGQHEESLRLTDQGLHLMQRAVEDGILDPSALAVPYHNLAHMHRELGDLEEADSFAKLAAKADERPPR